MAATAPQANPGRLADLLLAALLAAVILAACGKSGTPGASPAAAAPASTPATASADTTPRAGSAATGSTDELAQRVRDALSACHMPLAPDIPDGATASTERMLEGQRAFKAYDADTVTYTKCVDSAMAQVTREATGHASDADLNDLGAIGVRVHDTAVEQEQVAADSFNQQVRTFKAKHPK